VGSKFQTIRFAPSPTVLELQSLELGQSPKNLTRFFLFSIIKFCIPKGINKCRCTPSTVGLSCMVVVEVYKQSNTLVKTAFTFSAVNSSCMVMFKVYTQSSTVGKTVSYTQCC